MGHSLASARPLGAVTISCWPYPIQELLVGVYWGLFGTPWEFCFWPQTADRQQNQIWRPKHGPRDQNLSSILLQEVCTSCKHHGVPREDYSNVMEGTFSYKIPTGLLCNSCTILVKVPDLNVQAYALYIPHIAHPTTPIANHYSLDEDRAVGEYSPQGLFSGHIWRPWFLLLFPPWPQH